MCVAPISVKNNKLEFDPLTDRFYNFVPCGKCYECLSSNRQNYEVRSYYEFLYVKSLGGYAVYVTLTYNNDNLPLLGGFPVSSKYDIQCFLKRLRKKVILNSYFIVSEYGHKNFRPHYHCILYFVQRYPDIKDLILKAWNKGFIDYGSFGGFVLDARPFTYVSKYVGKDILFSNHYIPSYIHYKYSQLSVQERNKFSLYPFHLQSQNFGVYLLKFLKFDDFVRSYFTRANSAGLLKKYVIPLYIVRKKLYNKVLNKNGSVSYRLNSYGWDVFRSKLIYNYYKLIDLYKFLFNYSKNLDVYENCPNLQKVFTYSSWLSVVPVLVSEVTAVVSFQLLYHDCYKVPFSFVSFFDDLDTYIKCVRYSKVWFNYDDNTNYEVPFSDELCFILVLLSDIKCCVRYNQTLEFLKLKNVYQQHRSFVTSVKKLEYLPTFSEFKNLRFTYLKKQLCLDTFQSYLENLSLDLANVL